jgi:hypothetical protein
LAILLATTTIAQACVFELGELAPPTGSGGAGGASATGGVPADWWDDAFQHRMRLTLAQDLDDLSDAVLPVFLDETRLDYGSVEPGGADLRFVAADGSAELPHEIERWDPGGASLIWVRVPEVTAEGHLWMYWGNPGLPSGEMRGATWDGYEAVVHMSDPLEDTTITNPGTGPDLTAVGLSPSNVAEGLLGPAYRFDAQPTGQNISSSGDTGFAVPADGAATVESWFRWDGATGSFLAEHEGCCLGWAVRLQSDADVDASWGSSNCCSGAADYADTQAPLPGGAGDTDWHHVVVIFDRQGGTSEIYIDATLAGGPSPITPGADFSPQGKYRLGADFSGENSFGGDLDEARFAPFRYETARIEIHERAARDALFDYGPTQALP